MKRVVLMTEGLCDDPVAELGGRTPLELAKTPALDALAKRGVVAAAALAPRQLAPSADVACMSVLGYDPLEFYTGIAPLEAAALGVPQKDDEVAFCMDLVTVLDDLLVDPRAGSISAQESRRIVEELAARISDGQYKIHPGGGSRNILIVTDRALAEQMDDLVCAPPAKIVGEKYSKHLPKGKAEKKIAELIERARAVLEENEINRVRIDLNENPANLIWLWGQGKRPKLPGFRERFGAQGALLSEADFVKGLGKIAGLSNAKGDLERAIEDNDFLFVYFPAGMIGRGDAGLKARLRHIEEFDAAVVAAAAKKLSASGPYRLMVVPGCVESSSRRALLHDRAPVLLEGEGVEPDGSTVFHERAAAQSSRQFEEGFRMMEPFMKK